MGKFQIGLIEQSERRFTHDAIGILNGRDLQDLLESVKPLLEIIPGFDGKSLNFESDSRVGVLELPKIRIQVEPKMSASQFTTLLRYALGGQINTSHMRTTSSVEWAAGFEDALCRILCDEIEEILRIGLSRKYVEHQGSMDALRGRPVWHANFPWLGKKAREIQCRYHRLTFDNLDNQLIGEGLARAASFSRSEVKTIALRHLSYFRHLASSREPNLADFVSVTKGYNRLNEHYRVAHGLCKMFMFGLRPESFFKAGSQKIFGLVLDMAFVFEMFIQRLLEDLLKPRGYSIRSQPPDWGALLDAEGEVYSTVRPDFLVYKANRVLAVVDAKYKDYWSATPDGSRPQRKISNEDIYQLFFYQQRLQRLYDLPEPPAAIIAAPLPDDTERGVNTCIPERFREVKWRAGTDISGHVNLLLIPITEFLKLLNERKSISEVLTAIGLPEMVHGLS